MPSPRSPELPAALIATDNVSTGTALAAAGIARSTIAHRCKPGGPWRRLLPGVILLDRAAPTRRQFLRASVCRFGEHAVITGADALRAHGLQIRTSKPIRLLVPTDRRMLGTEHTAPERTTRLPAPTWIAGLPFATPQRAVIDTARQEQDPARVRGLVRLTVSEGLCGLRQLWEELEAGNQRGTAPVREALRALGNGDGLAAFAVAKRMLEHSPLPPPSWHVTVCDKRGSAIAPVDAWWDELAVGWQFSPGLTAQGKLAHLNLTAAGVVLVRSPAERLRENSAEELTRLAAGLRTAARRPRPAVRARR